MSDLLINATRLRGIALPHQRGVVVPIVAIGLLALLAVAGLALDGSHALANKTRMQNTADAAALAAAKVLDETEDTALATAAAHSLFAINADGAGNHELNDAYDSGKISVTVQYSATLNPFVSGSLVPGSDSWFVRVIATGFDTRTALSRVIGIDEIPTPATAVAGPSGPLGTGVGAILCDISPIAVCGSDVPGKDTDPNALRVLKPNPGTHGDIGPGNYKMLRFDGQGGAVLRENMAGAWDECVVVGSEVETEPGVSSGPVSQGFNTRFNKYQGAGLNPVDYPPDLYVSEQDIDTPNTELKACEDPADPLAEHIYLVTAPGANYCQGYEGPDTWPDEEIFFADAIPYNYADYSGADPGPPTAGGANWEPYTNRRVLRFPIIDCAGDQTGQSVLYTDSFACFFMVQSLEGGQADGAGNIFGQFIDECDGNGTQGINPGGGSAGPLIYKIQLYKDPDSGDS